MLVTMRGETGERNPWQVSMGQATPEALAPPGVRTLRWSAPKRRTRLQIPRRRPLSKNKAQVALLDLGSS